MEDFSFIILLNRLLTQLQKKNENKQARKVDYWEMTNMYVLFDPENSGASVKAKYEKMQKKEFFL